MRNAGWRHAPVALLHELLTGWLAQSFASLLRQDSQSSYGRAGVLSLVVGAGCLVPGAPTHCVLVPSAKRCVARHTRFSPASGLRATNANSANSPRPMRIDQTMLVTRSPDFLSS